MPETEPRCICGTPHCRRCGLSIGAAIAGVLCDPPFAGSHDFTTSPAPTPNADETGASA